jgi:purine-nucleoside phosphorylase
MSSPHINADPGAFADTVLLPGDPRRAQHIATTLLDNAVEVTDVRNMLGFTGSWNGHRVSVMGTGMGIPSTLIYATELVRYYEVRRLVRVGTCGAVDPSLDLGDIVVALGAGTDSQVNRIRFRGYDLPATASVSRAPPASAAAPCGSAMSSRATCSTTRMPSCGRHWPGLGCSRSRWRRPGSTAPRRNSASRRSPC